MDAVKSPPEQTASEEVTAAELVFEAADWLVGADVDTADAD